MNYKRIRNLEKMALLTKDTTMKLRYNEMKIPIIGFDTTLDYNDKGTKAAVSAAIDAGYKLFYCNPYYYGNERSVGEALKEKIEDKKIKREQIFIVTKVYMDLSHKPGFVEDSLQESLKALGLDYVDMFLLHCSVPKSKTKPDYTEAWRGMQNSYYKGWTKSIGLSNFYQDKIENLMKIVTIKPSANLLECNILINHKELRKYLKKNKILLMTSKPYGTTGLTTMDPGRESPEKIHINKLSEVKDLATKYNKTYCQIAIRYLIELQTIPLVKSGLETSIQANIDVFDFNFNRTEMKILNEVDKGKYDPNLKLYNTYPEDYAYIDLSNWSI